MHRPVQGSCGTTEEIWLYRSQTLRNSAIYGSDLPWGKLFPTNLLQSVANVIPSVCLDCLLTFMDQMILFANCKHQLPVNSASLLLLQLPLLAPWGYYAKDARKGGQLLWQVENFTYEKAPSLSLELHLACCEWKLCSLSAAVPHKRKIVSHKLLLKCTLHVNCKINSLNSFHWAQHQKENEPTAVDYFCWIGFNHLYWCPSFFSWLPSLKDPIANFIWVSKNRDIYNSAVFVSHLSSPFPPCISDQTYFRPWRNM